MLKRSPEGISWEILFKMSSELKIEVNWFVKNSIIILM